MLKSLSKEAEAIIENYLKLPFDNVNASVSAPYYNNQRASKRAAIPVMVGKGTPAEIVEEAEAAAIKKRIRLTDLAEDELKHFLVDHRLGVDCSGLSFHTLNAESQARGLGKLTDHIKFPLIKNPLRRFVVSNFRKSQNVSAATFAHEDNSREIKVSEVLPGDIICTVGPHKVTGEELPNHVIVVETVEYDDQQKVKAIHYINSIAWPADGNYGHGARRGVIEITNPEADLLDGSWQENGQTGEANYLYNREKNAGRVSLRRLNWF